jgi:hypothetical protein
MDLILATDRKELAKNDFDLVPEAKEREALGMLAESTWQKLSPQQAQKLLGKPPKDAVGGEWVLLRALSLNELNGAFSITWWDGAVRVHHGCLGRHPVRMTRRALIARLPGLPTEVYVDCSMVE